MTARTSMRPGIAALLVTAALLGGCASFSTDGGFGSVQSAAKDRLGKQVQWCRV